MSLFAQLKRRYRTARLCRELNLRTAAIYDATREPPLPSDAQSSASERTLIDRYEDRCAQLLAEREIALKSERLKTIDADLSADEASLTGIVSSCKTGVDRILLNREPDWQGRRAALAAAAREIDKFKRGNLLDRPCAEYAPLEGLAIVILALILEALGNAFLFTDVSPLGFAGGATIALLLSIPTVLLATLCALFGLRLRLHVDANVRRRGTIIAAIFSAANAFWLFYVAHVRVLAEARGDDPSWSSIGAWTGVLTQMREQPLAPFDNTASVELLIIGIATTAICLWKGFDGFVDRYPGYTQICRPYEHALTAYAKLRSAMGSQIRSAISDTIEIIDERADVAAQKVQEGLAIITRAYTTVARFERKLSDEHWVYREALQTYRGLNQRHRPAGDAPRRFDAEALPFAHDLATLPDWSTTRARLAALDKTVAQRRHGAVAELEAYELAALERMTPGPRAFATPPARPSLLPAE